MTNGFGAAFQQGSQGLQRGFMIGLQAQQAQMQKKAAALKGVTALSNIATMQDKTAALKSFDLLAPSLGLDKETAGNFRNMFVAAEKDQKAAMISLMKKGVQQGFDLKAMAAMAKEDPAKLINLVADEMAARKQGARDVALEQARTAGNLAVARERGAQERLTQAEDIAAKTASQKREFKFEQEKQERKFQFEKEEQRRGFTQEELMSNLENEHKRGLELLKAELAADSQQRAIGLVNENINKAQAGGARGIDTGDPVIDNYLLTASQLAIADPSASRALRGVVTELAKRSPLVRNREAVIEAANQITTATARGTAGAMEETAKRRSTPVPVGARRLLGGASGMIKSSSGKELPMKGITQGDLSDALISVPPADEQKRLLKAEAELKKFTQVAGRTIQTLRANPKAFTAAGPLSSFIRGLSSSVVGLSELGRETVGIEFPDAEEAVKSALRDSTVRGTALDRETIQADIVNMIFAAAAISGQTGRAVIERDLVRFAQEIGANSGDPQIFEAILQGFVAKTHEGYLTDFETATGATKDLGMDLPRLDTAKYTDQQLTKMLTMARDPSVQLFLSQDMLNEISLEAERRLNSG